MNLFHNFMIINFFFIYIIIDNHKIEKIYCKVFLKFKYDLVDWLLV